MDIYEAAFNQLEVAMDKAVMEEMSEDGTIEDMIEKYQLAKDLVLERITSPLAICMMTAMFDYKINNLKASLNILTNH